MNGLTSACHTSCPLCGGDRATVVVRRNDIAVCRCSTCGLVFAPEAEVAAKRGTDAEFYSIDYFEGREGSGYAAYHETKPTLERTAARQVATVLGRNPDRACLLEIGCGGGYFLKAVAPHFGRVFGVEICPGICEGPLPSNTTLFERALETIRPEELDVRPTVVVLWDVIEHFPRPREAVELIGRLAAPNALLILTTGNVTSPLARVLGKRWRLMTPLEHYSFFSPATIGRMLQAGGFRVERVSSAWKWVPLCLIAAQAGRMLGVGRSAWQLIPRSWRVPVNLGDVMQVEARHQ